MPQWQGKRISFWVNVFKMELLDHIVVLFSVFWRTAILFPIVAAPFAFPATVHKGSFFCTSLPTLVICSLFFYSFMITILTGLRRYLIVVLICISLTLLMLSVVSCVCWPFVCLWKNFYSDPFLIFNWNFYHF